MSYLSVQLVDYVDNHTDTTMLALEASAGLKRGTINSILNDAHPRPERFGQQDAGFTSSPPLAGGRCPCLECGGLGYKEDFETMTISGMCKECKGTGERSGLANDMDERARSSTSATTNSTL